MNDLIDLIPLILSVVAAIGSGIAWLANRGKADAEKLNLISDSFTELIEAQNARIANQNERISELESLLKNERDQRLELEDRVKVLEVENAQLRRENEALKAKLETKDGL